MNPDQLAELIRKVVKENKSDFVYYPSDSAPMLLLRVADALDQTESAKYVRDTQDARSKDDPS